MSYAGGDRPTQSYGQSTDIVTSAPAPAPQPEQQPSQE